MKHLFPLQLMWLCYYKIHCHHHYYFDASLVDIILLNITNLELTISLQKLMKILIRIIIRVFNLQILVSLLLNENKNNINISVVFS